METNLKLIFGLGNPGRKFQNSRHNLGSYVVKRLAKRAKIRLRSSKDVDSLLGRGKIKDKDVVLAIPSKFMNLCGIVLKKLLEQFNIDLKDTLIISDDMDLKRGKIRFRMTGSDGGHRGLRSIIGNLKTEDFSRLRIGIGRPPEGILPSDYVLGKFTKEEKVVIEGSIEEAISFVESWLEKDSR
jgi:PTH1 family peptidyl-tRNA hydrolase